MSWDKPGLVPGQTGRFLLLNSTVKSPFCPVCPWDGSRFVPGRLSRKGRQKNVHVFCVYWFFHPKMLEIPGGRARDLHVAGQKKGLPFLLRPFLTHNFPRRNCLHKYLQNCPPSEEMAPDSLSISRRGKGNLQTFERQTLSRTHDIYQQCDNWVHCKKARLREVHFSVFSSQVRLF